MKRWMLFGVVLVLISCGFVFALSEIRQTETKTLDSGNGICEYYAKEFSNGEIDSISVNGETLDIEYLGNKNWKVNDYEGKLGGHDFFVYNEKQKLKGVRFDFSYMDQHQPEGNLGLREQDYYPWDCQGYSQSTGLIKEIKINKGWNLVPIGISLRDCYYALEGELCKDDVLVSYFYIPDLNKYVREDELEKEVEKNPSIINFLDDDINPSIHFASKWIYVKPDAGNKKVIGDFGAYIPYRNSYLDDELDNGVFKLNSGWSFLFVDAFMVYDDNWAFNRLKIEDMKGSCDIERLYAWDNRNQKWETDNDIMSVSFSEEDVGSGIIIKVTEDCNLGYSDSNGAGPPGLPL